MSVEIIWDQSDGSIIREFYPSGYAEPIITVHKDLMDYSEHVHQPELPPEMIYRPQPERVSIVGIIKALSKLRPAIVDGKIDLIAKR